MQMKLAFRKCVEHFYPAFQFHLLGCGEKFLCDNKTTKESRGGEN
jgi:hypothetical protein